MMHFMQNKTDQKTNAIFFFLKKTKAQFRGTKEE